MDLYNRINNVKNKILKMEKMVSDNIKEKNESLIQFNSKLKKDKRYILLNYINILDTGDIFNLSSNLRNIGISKFHSLTMEKIESSEESNNFIKNFDINKSNMLIEQYKEDLKKQREEFEIEHQKEINYPIEIVMIFKKIFKDKKVDSQEKVIDYKLNKFFLNKINYLFRKRDYEITKNILKYYEIYNNHNLFTDGENLYEEYKKFSDCEKNTEEKSLNIQNTKRNLAYEEEENLMYKNELSILENEFNLESIKKAVKINFINFIEDEDMVEYYIEEFKSKIKNIELEEKNKLSELRYETFLKYNNMFESSNNYMKIEIANIKKDFKRLLFANFETSNLPLFSNSKYFLSEIKKRIKHEKIIIKKIGLEDEKYLLNDAENLSIDLKLTKKHTSIYIGENKNINFKKEELEKYYLENDVFVKYFKEKLNQ